MVQETWIQSHVASYQRLLKWYLIPSCLTLSNIRYVSRVKWSNPGKGVAPSPTPGCYSYWKGSLRVTLDYGRQLYLFTLKFKKYLHKQENREQLEGFFKYFFYSFNCCFIFLFFFSNQCDFVIIYRPFQSWQRFFYNKH